MIRKYLKSLATKTPGRNHAYKVFPAELELEIFSYLELKPLIIARCVCKSWRRLTLLADIYPPRLLLLELYYKIIAHPYFLGSRKWILHERALHRKQEPRTLDTDRELYISTLQHQCLGYKKLPEEYRLWILEWPEKATVHCVRPLVSPECAAGHHYGMNYQQMTSSARKYPIWWDKFSMDTDRLPLRLGDLVEVIFVNNSPCTRDRFRSKRPLSRRVRLLLSFLSDHLKPNPPGPSPPKQWVLVSFKGLLPSFTLPSKIGGILSSARNGTLTCAPNKSYW